MDKQISSVLLNETQEPLNSIVFKQRIIALHFILDEIIVSQGLDKDTSYALSKITAENIESGLIDIPQDIRMKLFHAKTKAELRDFIDMFKRKLKY